MKTVFDKPCMGNHGNRIYGAAAASKRLFCEDIMSFEEHEQELKEYQAFIEELGYASFEKKQFLKTLFA